MNQKLQDLAQAAHRIRRYALRMGEVQGQGYIAQALDIADVLAVAYFHAMTYRPQEPEWDGRDRFLLSHGHYAIAFYAALIEGGALGPELEQHLPALLDLLGLRSQEHALPPSRLGVAPASRAIGRRDHVAP